MFDELIAALRAVEADKSVEPSRYLTDGESGKLPATVQAVVDLACDVLIDSDGNPSANIVRLTKAGYPVRKGEGDSFGWLSGVIHTSKGGIVYG